MFTSQRLSCIVSQQVLFMLSAEPKNNKESLIKCALLCFHGNKLRCLHRVFGHSRLNKNLTDWVSAFCFIHIKHLQNCFFMLLRHKTDSFPKNHMATKLKTIYLSSESLNKNKLNQIIFRTWLSSLCNKYTYFYCFSIQQEWILHWHVAFWQQWFNPKEMKLLNKRSFNYDSHIPHVIMNPLQIPVKQNILRMNQGRGRKYLSNKSAVGWSEDNEVSEWLLWSWAVSVFVYRKKD